MTVTFDMAKEIAAQFTAAAQEIRALPRTKTRGASVSLYAMKAGLWRYCVRDYRMVRDSRDSS